MLTYKALTNPDFSLTNGNSKKPNVHCRGWARHRWVGIEIEVGSIDLNWSTYSNQGLLVTAFQANTVSSFTFRMTAKSGTHGGGQTPAGALRLELLVPHRTNGGMTARSRLLGSLAKILYGATTAMKTLHIGRRVAQTIVVQPK
jgi:hypothetical protein